MKSVCCALLAAGCLSLGTPVEASNIVLNSSFEDGDTPWVFGYDWINNPYGYLGLARTGDWAATTGCVGEACLTADALAQTLATTPGAYYDLNFWVAESWVEGPSALRVIWDGTEVATLVNPANNTCVYDYENDLYDCDWIQFSFNNLLASGSSTLLELFGRNDPDYLYVDDVSVTLSEAVINPVPEPATVLLVTLGLGGVLMSRHRRRTAA